MKHEHTSAHQQSDNQGSDTHQTTHPAPDVLELDGCRREVMNLKDEMLRIRADFENYKKRIDRERIQWTRSAQVSLLRDILLIMDDFERGLAYNAGVEVPPTLKPWVDGVLLTYEQAKKMLAKYGVTEITQMTLFDPHLHEAVLYVDAPEHAAGTIVQVVQKGYLCKDEILRPARVGIAR